MCNKRSCKIDLGTYFIIDLLVPVIDLPTSMVVSAATHESPADLLMKIGFSETSIGSLVQVNRAFSKLLIAWVSSDGC